MADVVLQYLPLTVASASLALAVLAWRRSRRASRVTPEKKPTPSSPDSYLEALDSALSAEKIAHRLQKLENRLRMRDVRSEKGSVTAPIQGASKGELYRYYGFTQSGPAFAQHQLNLERASTMNGKE